MRDCEPGEGVVDYLRDLGATDEQIAEAAGTGHFARLAVDLILRSRQVLTPREVAGRLGLTIDELSDLLRVLGLTIRAPDEPSLAEDDLAVLGVAPRLGKDVLRVAGASLGRLAEAAVASYVQTTEADLAASGADAAAFVRANVEVGQLALHVGSGLGSLFVHHVQEAGRWQRESQSEVREKAFARLAVGFVDLTGFTSFSQSLGPGELLRFITEFEATAHAVTARFGGRVVKHIGDEIMFVALDAGRAARIAQSLLSSPPADRFRPRGGLAFGDLLVRHGDYYGPIVNLAARLVDTAIPCELLVDEATARAAEAADAELAFAPAGRRLLQGFDEPVTTWSLS
jgi:class 3 adenylate cyclase